MVSAASQDAPSTSPLIPPISLSDFLVRTYADISIAAAAGITKTRHGIDIIKVYNNTFLLILLITSAPNPLSETGLP